MVLQQMSCFRNKVLGSVKIASEIATFITVEECCAITSYTTTAINSLATADLKKYQNLSVYLDIL
jgi:hypothetical protein